MDRNLNNVKSHRQCWLAILLAAACSCSSGPRAQPIEPPGRVLESATQLAGSDALIELTEYVPDSWWTLFNDCQLSEFIETAFARNPSLQASEAKVLQATYNADRMRSTLYPTLGWGGDVSRQKLSETGLIPFGSANALSATPGGSSLPLPPITNFIPVYFTQTETELALKYDFDIWGKNRHTLRAALGEVQANIADDAFSHLQLGMAVAQVYFQLQIGYKRQEIAQALVDNKASYLEIVQKRLNGNLNNIQTINAAQVNVTAVKQKLLEIQGDIAVNEYQLKAYLAGDFDEQIVDAKVALQPLPKVLLPCDLPLRLIARRPDIIAQLWMIESADRHIEVAKAGFYPDVNLTAFLGFQTIHLHELFWGRSKFFNVDPAFSLPIFEGGRLIANLRGSEVSYDAAIFQYNNLVINAAKEVLDGIAVLRIREQQLNETKKMTGYQQELFDISKLRVQFNLNSDLDYLTSEENMLMALDQQVVAQGRTIQAMLSLIKALGGGYDVCNIER